MLMGFSPYTVTHMNALLYMTTVLAVIACMESIENHLYFLIATSAACFMSAHLT